MDEAAVGVTVNGLPDDPLVIVSADLAVASVTVCVPSNVPPVSVTVQVEEATRRLPLVQPEMASVAALLVYPYVFGVGLTPELMVDVSVRDPRTAGVYVNVHVVPPVKERAAGVVPLPVPVQVTRVTVPDCPPSETVMIFGVVAQLPVRSVMVNSVPVTSTYPEPLDGVTE